MSQALSIRNLRFSYDPSLVVIEEVDLEICPGEFVAIFGPNGGGKTTLLRLILGLLQPQEGSIEIFGRSQRGPP